MPKHTKLKKHEEEVEDDFDFFDGMTDHDENDAALAAEVMTGMMEAGNHQMIIAMELTKLAIEKTTSGVMNEEKVFAAFRQASKTVAESSPLKEIFEKLPKL